MCKDFLPDKTSPIPDILFPDVENGGRPFRGPPLSFLLFIIHRICEIHHENGLLLTAVSIVPTWKLRIFLPWRGNHTAVSVILCTAAVTVFTNRVSLLTATVIRPSFGFSPFRFSPFRISSAGIFSVARVPALFSAATIITGHSCHATASASAAVSPSAAAAEQQ